MKIISHASEMTRAVEEARGIGKKISFVPTMGSLHEGHISLFREGKKRGGLLVASIFVNPRQFNSRSDFEKYPRDFNADVKKCEEEGVEIVFAPSEDEIYPPGQTLPRIPLPAVAKPLEGRSRPGHFDGVAQVVSRLFQIVQPDRAIFGMKDYQQLRVIQEAVKEQKVCVEIVPCPTVRTPEGLALSSRNSRLTPEGKAKALCISRSLKAAETLFREGERDPRKLEDRIHHELYQTGSMQVDYAAVVDAATLEEIGTLDKPALAAVAVFIEGVRLIDNCILDPNRARTKISGVE